ncbi:YIP1 family protein [Falsirhodobacter algicola]|uniref:Yip1 domain-containing protein n=1 Tax=Falsirhodobacter algicola TaxID=2692330 RepID=A0A8J8MRI8_9RHOB|nr:YIP1 family protein [Falsirhodobacter algicola]QUS35405.1 hypothetical protein GR316_03440 [Falsirhodobacter algicola]
MSRGLLSLVAQSVQDPRAGLRAILDLEPDAGERGAFVGVAAILPTLLIFLTLGLAGQAPAILPVSPLALLLVQGGALLFMSALAFGVGRWRGGRGSFADCVLMLSWLQIVMVAVQAGLLVVEIALPPLGPVIGILAMVLMLWLLTNFLMEVHGFTHRGLVLVSIIGTTLGASIVLGIITSLFMGPTNV